MKKYFFGAFFLLLFSAKISEAAPAPWGIAINTENKECAGYWAGDEFVDYKLPEGWKAYYPTSNPENNLWDIIRTDAGECSFQIRKEEACCMELGYAFVSDNIGKGQKTILRDREAFEKALQRRRNQTPNYWIIPIFLLAIAGAIVGIKYLKKRRNNLPHRGKNE
jgi:hypothetical protein